MLWRDGPYGPKMQLLLRFIFLGSGCPDPADSPAETQKREEGEPKQNDAGPSFPQPTADSGTFSSSTVDGGSLPQLRFDAGGTWPPMAGTDAGSPPGWDAGGLSDAVSDAGVVSVCPDRLEVTPEVAYVSPWGLVSFALENGLGPFRFTLTSEAPSGMVSELLGRYSAGAAEDVVDTVEVTFLVKFD